MKIISSGTHKVSDGSVIFTCPHCGCKFSASPDEYYQDTSWYNGNLNITYTFTNTYSTCYHANCPECYKMCLETEERNNKFWYNVTCDDKTISSDHVMVTCSPQGCDSCD